jgi:peroxiredoxin
MPTSTLLPGLAAACLLALAAPAAIAHEPVPESAESVRPLLPGSTLPQVEVSNVQGESVRLDRLIEGQPAVIVFYRGGWCPFCTIQLSQLGEIEPELVALGYRVLAISPDRPELLAEGADDTPPSRTLLSDSSAAAARAFGIAFRVDAATVEQYRGYGIDLAAASGHDHHLLPVPAVFVVDAGGVIQFAYVHPDYRYRVPGELILAAARTLKDLKPLR